MKKITKRAFYRLGGVQNPRLFRRQRGRTWFYFEAGR
jgi:hypothetical protein